MFCQAHQKGTACNEWGATEPISSKFKKPNDLFYPRASQGLLYTLRGGCTNIAGRRTSTPSGFLPRIIRFKPKQYGIRRRLGSLAATFVQPECIKLEQHSLPYSLSHQGAAWQWRVPPNHFGASCRSQMTYAILGLPSTLRGGCTNFAGRRPSTPSGFLPRILARQSTTKVDSSTTLWNAHGGLVHTTSTTLRTAYPTLPYPTYSLYQVHLQNLKWMGCHQKTSEQGVAEACKVSVIPSLRQSIFL